MVSLVNSHTNSTRIGWHLWEIDLRFAPGLPPGWQEQLSAGHLVGCTHQAKLHLRPGVALRDNLSRVASRAGLGRDFGAHMRNQHICVRAARPSGRARCGAGAGCSAIKHQSLWCRTGLGRDLGARHAPHHLLHRGLYTQGPMVVLGGGGGFL